MSIILIEIFDKYTTFFGGTSGYFEINIFVNFEYIRITKLTDKQVLLLTL